MLGLDLQIISRTAAPGTIDPADPTMYGDTHVTTYEHLDFTESFETVTCANCATLHVTKDYHQEVTSITPSGIPPLYDQSGLNTIIAHEGRRVDIYRRAYYGYLAKVKEALDGTYLCCNLTSRPSPTLSTWADNVQRVYEDAWQRYVTVEQALVSNEYLNLTKDPITGLINGTSFEYSPAGITDVILPAFPTCTSF